MLLLLSVFSNIFASILFTEACQFYCIFVCGMKENSHKVSSCIIVLFYYIFFLDLIEVSMIF